ncbi:hypothetical protein GGI24_006485, partial [Coemansia furcata]
MPSATTAVNAVALELPSVEQALKGVLGNTKVRAPPRTTLVEPTIAKFPLPCRLPRLLSNLGVGIDTAELKVAL